MEDAPLLTQSNCSKNSVFLFHFRYHRLKLSSHILLISQSRRGECLTIFPWSCVQEAFNQLWKVFNWTVLQPLNMSCSHGR